MKPIFHINAGLVKRGSKITFITKEPLSTSTGYIWKINKVSAKKMQIYPLPHNTVLAFVDDLLVVDFIESSVK